MARPAHTPLPRTLLALVLVASGLSLALADTSESDVRRAFKSRDKDKVTQVLQDLRGHLDRNTTRAVLDYARYVKPLGVYDALVKTLRSATGDALQELVQQYRSQHDGDVRFLIVDALGKNPDPQAEKVLVTAVKRDHDAPVRILAIRMLGKRGTKSAVDALIPILAEYEKKPREQRLVRELNAALENLTGQDMTVAQDWKNFWDAHRKDYTKPVDPSDEGKTQTRTVMDRMRKERPAELKTITRLHDNEILVVRGRSDRCEDVLTALKLHHTVIDFDAFDSQKLDPLRQVLVLNCPGGDTMDDAGITKIRRFVAEGGYVFGSDWVLKKTFAKAFPRVIHFLRETPRGRTRQVTIKPARGAMANPLMRDVFPMNTWVDRSMSWKLHSRSDLPKIGPGVVPLVICPELRKLGSETVAFTFGFTSERGGRPVTGPMRYRLKNPGGQVLWVSSHFKDQRDPKGDGFALQQLLLNFIIEKQDQRQKMAERKE